MRLVSSPTARMTVAGMLAALAASVLPASTAHAAEPQAPGSFTGYGFDTCVAPSQTVMDRWNLSSQYSAIGIYISGNSRYCGDAYQPNLSPAWVADNAAIGWRFIPIHVGYQAPCFKNNPESRVQKKRMSRTTSTARSQATSDANEAVAALKKYGFPAGSFTYLDIEYYSRSDTSCDAAVRQFVDAFDERVHALGFKTGLYSSGSAAIASINAIRTASWLDKPDHMWIAWTNRIADTDGGPYLADSAWNHHERIHQYHNGVNETYGGKTLNIDKDFLDVGKGSVRPAEQQPCGHPMTYQTWPGLTLGSRADQVWVLECRLKAVGQLQTVDGYLSTGTIAAINRFRASLGWSQNSRTSREFWTALLSAGSQPRVLKYGDVGEDVYRLQRALRAAGEDITSYGKFNAQTAAAVRRYRLARDLAGYRTATAGTWVNLQKGKLTK